MSAAAPDVVELLLPEADEPRRARARRVATCLRLLANDASPCRAARVGLELESARAELARGTRERLQEALRELLACHLAAVRSADTFLTLEPFGGDARAAWSVLEEERAGQPWLAGVPEPGESPLEVAGRLLACARRLELDPRELELWEARRSALALGAREGERAFRALFTRAADAPSLAGALECMLERGAVARARALLDSAGEAARADAHVARLASWIRLLVEGTPAAASRAPAARVPAPLVALRRVGEPFRSALAGRAARGATRRLPNAAGRREVGAALLAVFALTRGGLARRVHAEAAPARTARLAAWCEGREDAARSAAALEHAALTRAEPCVAHARDDAALPGAQDPGGARAAAVVPVLERDGEALGWLRLEFEHHLVPSPGVLRELARAWAASLRAARLEAAPAQPARNALCDAPAARAGDPRGELFAELVEGLGLKLAQRRWWGVVPEAEGAQLVAEGGGALREWRVHSGGGRALARSLLTAGSVRFEEGDAGLALCADSRSGVALPLRHGAHLAGVLEVESTRRRDLRDLDARLARAPRPWALELRLADFRAWHRSRWGSGPVFDVQHAASRRRLEDLLAAAAASGPLCLSGAPGSGKRVLSRLAHHGSQRRSQDWSEHACGALARDAEARELFAPDGALEAARAGTLHLAHAERLAPELQLQLAARLAAPQPPVVVVALARPLCEGALRPELARALARRELFVPSVAERRAELPLVIANAAQRFARELGRGEVQLDDALVACLWRQPYEGELRAVEDLVYRLVLCSSAGELGLDDLREVARRFRVDLIERVPSRDVDPAWVEAALWATRTRRGSENKTRAALYLGWDPDTLARVRAALLAG